MIFLLRLMLMLQPLSLFAQAIHKQPEVLKTQTADYPFCDKSLTKKKIKELIVHFWPDRQNIIVLRILKLDGDNDWTIQYSQNIPRYKCTNRKITYVYKKDNTCFKVESLIFYRDYLGGGQYGEIHIGYSGDTKTIENNCNNKSSIIII